MSNPISGSPTAGDEAEVVIQRPGLARLKSQASYTVPGDFQADTQDNEDYTFNGIMFPVETLDLLPVEYIEIQSISVRGDLGKVTVWSTTSDMKQPEVYSAPEKWVKHHDQVHESSMSCLVEMILDPPVITRPGEHLALYVHSAEESDQGIVYDNQRSTISAHDRHVVIRPGKAHISSTPFSSIGYWGGGAWRNLREFVGRISYGVKFKLWRPVVHSSFPNGFKQMCMLMLFIHNTRGSLLYNVPSDVVLYLLNMCPWDWGGDLQEDETQRLKELDDEKNESTGEPFHYYAGGIHPQFNLHQFLVAHGLHQGVEFEIDDDDEDDESYVEDDDGESYMEDDEEAESDQAEEVSAATTSEQASAAVTSTVSSSYHFFQRRRPSRIQEEENPRFGEEEENDDEVEEADV